MKKLGHKQQNLILWLENGCFITEQIDHSMLETDYWLEDLDGNMYRKIPHKMITSLLNRNLLKREPMPSSVEVEINRLILATPKNI